MPRVGCRELGMIIKLPPDKVVPNDDFITDVVWAARVVWTGISELLLY